jgi:hypothetical protein
MLVWHLLLPLPLLPPLLLLLLLLHLPLVASMSVGLTGFESRRLCARRLHASQISTSARN